MRRVLYICSRGVLLAGCPPTDGPWLSILEDSAPIMRDACRLWYVSNHPTELLSAATATGAATPPRVCVLGEACS